MQSLTRRQLRLRDGNRCVVCGSPRQLTIHHLRPRAIGGSDELSNLVTLCRDCHEALEDPIRNTLATLASWLVWLLLGPRLTIARLYALHRRRRRTSIPL